MESDNLTVTLEEWEDKTEEMCEAEVEKDKPVMLGAGEIMNFLKQMHVDNQKGQTEMRAEIAEIQTDNEQRECRLVETLDKKLNELRTDITDIRAENVETKKELISHINNVTEKWEVKLEDVRKEGEIKIARVETDLKNHVKIQVEPIKIDIRQLNARILENDQIVRQGISTLNQNVEYVVEKAVKVEAEVIRVEKDTEQNFKNIVQDIKVIKDQVNESSSRAIGTSVIQVSSSNARNNKLKFDEFNRESHPVRFIKELEKQFLVNHWPENQKIQFALDGLEGDAVIWAERLQENWQSFDDFKVDFLNKFWSTRKQEQIRYKIHSPRSYDIQAGNYQHHVWFWVQQTQFLQPPLSEEIFIEAVIRHFPYEVERILLAARVKTVEDLLQVVEGLDRQNGRQSGTNSGRTTNFNQENNFTNRNRQNTFQNNDNRGRINSNVRPNYERSNNSNNRGSNDQVAPSRGSFTYGRGRGASRGMPRMDTVNVVNRASESPRLREAYVGSSNNSPN